MTAIALRDLDARLAGRTASENSCGLLLILLFCSAAITNHANKLFEPRFTQVFRALQPVIEKPIFPYPPCFETRRLA